MKVTGLGGFEWIDSCLPCAEGYVSYLRGLYEKATDSFNRDTLYCKFKVVEMEVTKEKEKHQ